MEQQQQTQAEWADEFFRDYQQQQQQQQQGPPPRGAGPDLAPLFALVEQLRRGVPRDLQDQFNSLLREVLLTLRALIDWYIERIDRAERKPEVEDIPIE